MAAHTITIDPDHPGYPILPDDLDEQAALRLFHALRDHFGWAGTFFTREDCAQQAIDAEGDYAERPLTDAEWEAVQRTWEWRKGIEEVLCERGWDIVADAVSEALGPDA